MEQHVANRYSSRGRLNCSSHGTWNNICKAYICSLCGTWNNIRFNCSSHGTWNNICKAYVCSSRGTWNNIRLNCSSHETWNNICKAYLHTGMFLTRSYTYTVFPGFIVQMGELNEITHIPKLNLFFKNHSNWCTDVSVRINTSHGRFVPPNSVPMLLLFLFARNMLTD